MCNYRTCNAKVIQQSPLYHQIYSFVVSWRSDLPWQEGRAERRPDRHWPACQAHGHTSLTSDWIVATHNSAIPPSLIVKRFASDEFVPRLNIFRSGPAKSRNTVGVNKKFPFVSRATERPLPFRSCSNSVYFPFTCRLTSGPFRSVVLKRSFRSIPLCWNDHSVPFLFCKWSLRSLFCNDRSLFCDDHSLRWNNCSLCWNNGSIRCLKTFVRLFKRSFRSLSWNDRSFC